MNTDPQICSFYEKESFVAVQQHKPQLHLKFTSGAVYLKACKRRIFSKLNFLKDRTQSVVVQDARCIAAQRCTAKHNEKNTRNFTEFLHFYFTPTAQAGIEVFPPRVTLTTMST